MKVLWGTSLDPIRDGDRFDGEVFAAAETDDALLRALDDAVEQEAEIIMDAELPLGWGIVKWLGGAMFLLYCTSALNTGVTLEEGYHNAPGLFWAAVIGGLIWLVLLLVENHRKNSLSTAKSAPPSASGRKKRCKPAMTRWTCRRTRWRWTCWPCITGSGTAR